MCGLAPFGTLDPALPKPRSAQVAQGPPFPYILTLLIPLCRDSHCQTAAMQLLLLLPRPAQQQGPLVRVAYLAGVVSAAAQLPAALLFCTPRYIGFCTARLRLAPLPGGKEAVSRPAQLV